VGGGHAGAAAGDVAQGGEAERILTFFSSDLSLFFSVSFQIFSIFRTPIYKI
jgi:hypothetical protein